MIDGSRFPKNRAFRVEDGWNCLVHGRVYGTWATREYAEAAIQVEERRAAQRAKKYLTQEQWDTIVAEVLGT